MRTRILYAVLIVSLLLNVGLAAILVRGWLEHRRQALGVVSTRDALKSVVSTTLLPRIQFVVLVADEQPSAEGTPYSVPPRGQTLYARGAPVLTNGDIASAAAIRGQIGQPALRLIFTPEGARKIRKATEENPGKRLLFVADGKVLIAPVIMGPINAGKTVVSGSFDEDEVERIALALARS